MPGKLDVAMKCAESFLGIPYIWGGNHPSLGFDCSGLVQEILASVGLDPPGDQTAQSLYDNLKKMSENSGFPKEGSLLFFGKSLTTLTHVAFAISDKHMIEAGGGGSHTLTVKDAIAHGAFVRLRPIEARKDLMACLFPKYWTMETHPDLRTSPIEGYRS